MPQQLIYTSAQRGIVAGRSGYCTVARSSAMREALMLQLEKLSYYQHRSLSGGQERRISACRLLEIRGTRYHVLSRIQDAGLDFTGRTNFLAHHLVFTPEEIRQFSSPPIILRNWSGWVNQWAKDPENLENEDWGNLSELSTAVSVPAQMWQKITGDAVNGYGLLEARPGASFRVDDLKEDQILDLFAESLELLDLRDARKDFRATAWQYTFITSMQEQDNPADFRWRCIHADNSVSARFASPDCRALSEVRCQRATSEEKIFAQLGRQAPRFVAQPQNVHMQAGEPARLVSRAEGVPAPGYQWYSIDKNGNGQIIANATGAELVLANPPFGLSRYVVRAFNSVGEATSEVAKLECEQKSKISVPPRETVLRVTPKDSKQSHVKSAEDIENQRNRLAAEEEQRKDEARRFRSKIFAISGGVLLVILLGITIAIIGIYKSTSRRTANGPSSGATVSSISSVGKRNLTDTLATNPAHSTIASGGFMSSQIPQPKEALPPEIIPLPSGWSKAMIGDINKSLVDPFNPPSQFELTSTGGSFQSNQDGVFFVYRTNFEHGFTATVSKTSMASPTGLNGIMMRDSQSNDSRFVFIGATSKKIYLYKRDDHGAFASTNFDLSDLTENPVFIFKFEIKDGRCTPSFTHDSIKWLTFVQYEFLVHTQTMVGFAQSYGISPIPAKAKFVYLATEN